MSEKTKLFLVAWCVAGAGLVVWSIADGAYLDAVLIAGIAIVGPWFLASFEDG